MTASAVARALLIVILASATGGCGIALEGEPVAIPADVLPSPVMSTPSPPATALVPPPASTPASTPTSADESVPADAVRLRVWFVQEGGLTAVESALPTGTDPDLVMQTLVVGPSPQQTAQGLRTIASDPLTGRSLVSIVATPTPFVGDDPVAPVTVQLSPDFTALPPTEQILLLGQVVLSLTGAGETSVSFVDTSGTPVAVPLPDGRLLDTPARARDYGPLIFRP